MLKGPYKNIRVGSIEAFDLARDSVIQLHILNLQLIAVLSALNLDKFNEWFKNKYTLTTKEESCRMKNVVTKYLNNLNGDLNSYMAKLGYFNFMKREDELPFEEIDLKNNVYLSIVNDKSFTDNDKFLSLASYFKLKLDAVGAKVEKASRSWKDEQFDEFKTRLSKVASLGVQKYPEIFRDYARICQKENIKWLPNRQYFLIRWHIYFTFILQTTIICMVKGVWYLWK